MRPYRIPLALSGWLLALCLWLVPQLASAQPVFAWQIRSQTATLYLLGSLHAFPPQGYPLPQAVEAAFSLSDYLVVEINPTDLPLPAQQKLFDHYGNLQNGQRLSDLLSARDQQRLRQHAQQLGLDYNAMQPWQPWRAGTQLVLADAERQGFDTTAGIDHYFMRRAGNRQILALETLESQLQAIAVPDMNIQVANLVSTLDQMEQDKDFLPCLYQAWRRGDGPAVYRQSEQEAGDDPRLKAYLDRLNSQRNAEMADKLIRLLRSSGTFFVVVGALHMPGPDGLLARLNAANFPSQQLQSPR
ncbi:TraB/GumN family protein [Pokkaliibacter plantistimulans]|uniref:TraB/GumN family protein n=1 Tax=Pokkaliibacter plantistimulans TaxID=1635171 RepID=UPI000D74B949|nr:TraB/GumN family protein [Pokkaliibacter plantistimulans]